MSMHVYTFLHKRQTNGLNGVNGSPNAVNGSLNGVNGPLRPLSDGRPVEERRPRRLNRCAGTCHVFVVKFG
eukprot:11101240-Heterocapsa_arctica.AAC.1